MDSSKTADDLAKELLALPADVREKSEDSAAAPTPGRAEESVMIPIQLGSPSASPPSFRFVILPVHDKAWEFYVPFRPLGYCVDGTPGNVNLDSGVDIPCPRAVTIPPETLVKIPLGVRVRGLALFWNMGSQAPPVGIPSAFDLRPRSSIARVAKQGNWGEDESDEPQRVLLMPNSPGTIDVNYTGELKVQLYNPHSSREVKLEAGEAVVQITAPTLNPVEYNCAQSADCALAKAAFPETQRGSGGFGSTGVTGSSAKS